MPEIKVTKQLSSVALVGYRDGIDGLLVALRSNFLRIVLVLRVYDCNGLVPTVGLSGLLLATAAICWPLTLSSKAPNDCGRRTSK